QKPKVWDFLEEVIQEHPVLLNRAPTLHRLGIQAFEPVLVEGKAIKIHPLVCTAFNADFDGDQMAVHIPLSPKAQIEAQVLMLSTQNLLSPSNGQPVVVPTQDIVLGVYYLTKVRDRAKGEGRIFGTFEEALLALEVGEVDLLARVRVRYSGELIDLTTVYDEQDILHTEIQVVERQLIDTTVGRILFNDHLPEGIPFINGLLKKKGLGQLVQFSFLHFGNAKTVVMLDELKTLGFYYAMKAGISIGIDDMVIPANKEKLINEARKAQISIENEYQEGAITPGERYNKVIAIWSDVTERISEEMFREMEKIDQSGGDFNPIYMMADSGARGSKQQMRQLAGMRGLMAKPSGEIIETPITSNFREGLSVLQYFISTHGARKGLADTALKTADSGYLTRRLVDVAQDVIISEDDCQTLEGIHVTAIVEGGEVIESLRDRLIGRVVMEDLYDPLTGDLIVKGNEEVTDELANLIQATGLEKVKIRSVLTCETRRGVCIRCYGRNLATGRMVELGEAVGVIAAQSIGEPGTQLTMRTFHIGGTAAGGSEQSHQESKNPGAINFINLSTVRGKGGDLVVTNRTGSLVIQDTKGREKERYSIAYGATLKVVNGQHVDPGVLLVEWDPYTMPILTEVGGLVHFKDVTPGDTMREEVDEVTGFAHPVIVESPDEKKQPRIAIKDAKTGRVIKEYLLPAKAHLMTRDKDAVVPGSIIAKIPRETTKTKDITGGLPRVVELFEARRPKEPAVITEIDGAVQYGEVAKGKRKIIVTDDETGEARDYDVPKGVHINIQEGERVRAGEPLIDGPRDPHDILRVKGKEDLQQYMVNEIQEVYRLQGVTINDKHIEVIVRQMMRWVKIEDVGDTEFIVDEQVDKFRFQTENERVISDSGQPATGRPLLLGITKASLSTESFISAASFQETTRVLTEAAISGKIDYLRGLKENVIMGRLIPAGTGLEYYRTLRVAPDGPPPVEDLLPEGIETSGIEESIDQRTVEEIISARQDKGVA
ncbi:MAG: DNA-directed RNA polymerase subunit beta', partial [Acidobacteria bacterium]|nr:DNA-directed RNA polymerase subunit beta' [Acidobacteriota bacterium]